MPIVSQLATVDFESITVAATAIGLSVGKVFARPQPQKAIITVETASIRYRDDGTDPTSTVGHLLQPGDVLTLENRGRMQLFKAIRSGATSATLMASYLR